MIELKNCGFGDISTYIFDKYRSIQEKSYTDSFLYYVTEEFQKCPYSKLMFFFKLFLVILCHEKYICQLLFS